MAGIFDRISTLMRANINALLDSAEDPEKTLDQIIRDMRSAIDDARSQVAEMIARERLLQREIEENRSMADEWDRKAAQAVQQVNQTLSQFSTYDPSSELKRMEERINLQEARAQAGVEMREVSL